MPINLKEKLIQKRFIVKPVKIVWRNSMIAGNPVVKSFQKFGVYDNNWQNDPYCWCPNPGGQFVALWHARKYRIVVDNEELAKKIAEKLETLYSSNAKKRQPSSEVAMNWHENS